MAKAKKPVDRAKMLELLSKIRKGADSSLTLGKLEEILEFLGGWTIEPFVGLVAIHHEEGPTLRYVHHTGNEKGGLAQVEAAHQRVLQRQVAKLPAKPEVGRSYTRGVTPIRAEGYFGSPRSVFEYEEWVGAKGLVFISPEKKTFLLLPDRRQLHDGGFASKDGAPASSEQPGRVFLGVYAVSKWLKNETGYLKQVNEALGTDEHVPGLARTRDNTGTCTYCFRNIKLDSPSKMALHGYQRPRDGSGAVGKCHGMLFGPYELSRSGCDHHLKSLQAEKLSVEKAVRLLEAGTAISIPRRTGDPFRPGDPGWDGAVKNAIKSSKINVETIKQKILGLEKMIRLWRVRSLPREGNREMPPPLSDAFDRWVKRLDDRA